MSDHIHHNLISVSEAKALLLAHDGDCALLYLWFAVTGSRDYERAARDLCMTRAQVDIAAEKLSRMLPENVSADAQAGLGSYTSSALQADKPTTPATSALLQPADELPEYTAEEITSFSHRDSGFQALLAECELVFGKQLTRNDMSRLLGIYNHLGLSAEVLFVLLHYCADTSRGPAGADRKPTMRYIEQQAYIWANRQINTMEAAEEYVEAQKAQRENENRIKRLLEIYDRSLISTEKAAISSWVAMGFSDDAIRLAYERCIDNIDRRSFSYINTILTSWHNAGIHTASEAEAKDPGRNRAAGKPAKKKAEVPVRPFTPTEF